MLLLAKLRVDTNWSPPPRCKERAATTTIPYFRRSTGRKAATIIPSPHKGGGGGFRNLPSTFASSSSSSSLSKLNNIALDDDDYLTPPPFDPVAYAETNIEYPWEHSIQGKDFPTIFQPLMDWFLPYIAQNLDHLSPTTTTMDRDMMLHLGGAAYISNQGSGDSSSSSQRHLPSIRMGTLVFESKKFRRIRITHYDGGETQVFNSLWYPHTHIDAPLLGINMVSFGEEGRRQLCIIDFQPLDSQHEDLALPLRHIKETHPSLNGTLSTKFYDGKYFSPHMILGKFEKSRDMIDVAFPAMKLAIEEYIQMVDQRQNVTDENVDSLTADDRRERQDEYNRYNAKVDPSLGIYEAQFGRDWARNYISNVKFS